MPTSLSDFTKDIDPWSFLLLRGSEVDLLPSSISGVTADPAVEFLV
jgi:hypothetical protein